MKAILRSLFLVVLTMAWHEASDRISDHFGIETFASPWKLPLIAIGTLITCGGIVGGGIVVWGNTSLRELGWTRPTTAQIAVGLAQTTFVCAMIAGVYAVMGGREGLRELGHMMRTMTLGQRVFFAVMGARNAFLEESLFRGDLLKSIDARFGVVAAVIGSSAIFALHHRTLSPLSLTMKFAIGVLWALSATRMRSLIPSALSHTLVWAIMANA